MAISESNRPPPALGVPDTPASNAISAGASTGRDRFEATELVPTGRSGTVGLHPTSPPLAAAIVAKAHFSPTRRVVRLRAPISVVRANTSISSSRPARSVAWVDETGGGFPQRPFEALATTVCA